MDKPPIVSKPHPTRLTLSVAGGCVVAMMGVGPDEAEINFCKWPRKIVPQLAEACLPGISSDSLQLIAVAMIFGGVIWYLWPRIRSGDIRGLMLPALLIAWFALTAVTGFAVYQHFSGAKLELPTSRNQAAPSDPLVWDNHLGHSYSGTALALVTNAIQIGAANQSERQIKIEDAFINSDETGERIELKAPSGSAWKAVADSQPTIEPKKSIVFRAEFNPPAGIPSQNFYAVWKSMTLSVKYDGVVRKRPISEEMVRALFSSFKPNPIELPLVTDKPDKRSKIDWNIEEHPENVNFLGLSLGPNGPQAHHFWTRGWNRTIEPISSPRAYIRAENTTAEYEGLFNPGDGKLLPASKVKAIPVGAMMDITIPFRPDRKPIPLSNFLSEFVPFTFFFKSPEVSYRQTITKELIEHRIRLFQDRVNAKAITPPRIQIRDDKDGA